ncbi:class C beta-lactamase [Janthinobacterium sp.]|uniref:class C beta-lactamase n=1 Tax=Janthinobacterium sp. TaxID=1871054 RepID=UPI00293D3FAF|nr:class C beta-lactamase [Janthinobacterium sp.]
MKFSTLSRAAAVFCGLGAAAAGQAADDQQARVADLVARTILPVMEKNQIPGVAIGVVADGKSYVFNYGVASMETAQPVAKDTLFELGSISKTFAVTLAAYAQVSGKLSLSDPISKYLPSLKGSPFGAVSLYHLGTHTPGGLPLQVPDEISNNEQLLQYFKEWRPTYAAGTYRTYANPGIGTLGWIAAKSMGQDYTALIERRLFPALGMTHSYIDIPADRLADYAQGYTKQGVPRRMQGGVLAAEAYGVKSTATDMLRFVAANMNMLKLEDKLGRAITDTHKAYFKAGVMTQDLIWEQYPYPVALKTLREGNSYAMVYDASPVTAIEPPQAPRGDVWINKTGSTGGFGAYVAFVPAQRLGIVILANKNYPNEDRIDAAHAILGALAEGQR